MTYASKEKINLNFLIEFYEKVWFEYASHKKNDEMLYELFNKKNGNEDFMLCARIYTLSGMYSARVYNVHDMLEAIRCAHAKQELYNSDILENYCKKEGNHKLISFISKYCHWYNEVNNIGQATPIYDGNVRDALKHYKCETNGKIKDYEGLKDGVDEFIKEVVKESSDTVISLPIGGLHTQLSIYRLVDKFLWLSYKVKEPSKNDSNLLGIANTNDKYFEIIL
jgi:hypothetical protein